MSVLTKISMKTPSTAIMEMNPDCATEVRPILWLIVKQMILVPCELLKRACSSDVHILRLPFEVIMTRMRAGVRHVVLRVECH
jgi:hypothetical protein